MEDGFTRIANELMEQVMAAPLTLREMRVVLAVIRLTYGWNRKQARVTGGLLGKLTGLPDTKASQTLAALVEKNVVTRHGGSRSPVSFNKHADQWKLHEPSRKTPPPKQGNPVETYQTGEPQPKRYDSYQNGKSESYQIGNASKDMKDIPPLPSVEGEGRSPKSDQDQKPSKPSEAKPGKGKPIQLDLSNLPGGVTPEAVQGFIEHRKALKKPLTQRALNLNVNEALRAAERIPDLTPDQALDETVLAGWQGVKADWLVRRLSTQQRQGAGMNAAERVHAANQEAVRQAVENRRAGTSHWGGQVYEAEGGHW
ncbi:replication protein [Halomonas sp. V046]|uniref:replication protein n=1 Tax=Halomonas sp. V046 TaxID=3459611 RepID=UPI0040441356